MAETSATLLLRTEPIGKLLLRYSLPAIAAMVVFSLYNIIDSIFIGHGVGPLAISGLAITFPVMNLTFALVLLVGIGGASICSIRLGQQDIDGATRVLGNVLLLGLINGVTFGLLSQLVLDPVLTAFGASEHTLPYARDFMQIILYGLPVTCTMFGLNHVMRATGYPQKAMLSAVLTVGMNVISLILTLIIAIPIGILSACRQNSLLDRGVTVFVYLGFAMPSFWLALLLMLFFGIHLQWLPISGLTSMNFDSLGPVDKVLDLARHLALPILVYTIGSLAGMSRYMRACMLEVLRQDYILTAQAKGLSPRTIIWRHALRNALLPVITLLGLSVPGLIGGSVIIESIFALPGLGQLFYAAVMARDYTMIMGNLVLGAVLTLLGNLLADVCYGLADPRIRSSREVR